MNGPVLPPAFYRRRPLEVARDLLGKTLVRSVDGRRRAGRIVETEAYGGPEDPASHARFGPNGRARPMWGPPGTAYVYLIYGLHHCLNPVTGPVGVPGAVLIRALEPLEGIDGRTDGPGRLCRALAIDRSLDGEPLDRDRLWIEDAPPVAGPVEHGRRVGVDFAGAAADWPWRLWIAGSGWVSGQRARRQGVDSTRM